MATTFLGVIRQIDTPQFRTPLSSRRVPLRKASRSCRDEIAQVREANRLCWHGGKKKIPGAAGLGTSASKRAEDAGRVVGAHQLGKNKEQDHRDPKGKPSRMPEAFTAVSPIPLLRITPRVGVRRRWNSQIALIRKLL